MRKTIFALCTALALSACGVASMLTGIPTSPSAVADRTKVDEQAGITVTLAYTAASKAAALAIRTGLVTSAATIKRIGELDTKAYAAVVAVHDAYKAANAASYGAAIAKANAVIGELVALAGGGTSSATTPGQRVAAELLAANARLPSLPQPQRFVAAQQLNDVSALMERAVAKGRL